jgi:hypothetical protein
VCKGREEAVQSRSVRHNCLSGQVTRRGIA